MKYITVSIHKSALNRLMYDIANSEELNEIICKK